MTDEQTDHEVGSSIAGDDLAYLGATEAVERFNARTLSPVELAEAIFDRTERTEPQLNAFAEMFFDEALDAAREAERRYKAGTARPLEGLLVAVKEEAPIAGQKNTLGSLPLRNVVAEETAPFVQRILDAGGIVHARTTTPEFSSAPFTWSHLWGVTYNPWNRAFNPGGSSGGSAASLAAGTSTLATGSDIGGSIRIPASFCGVVGFKPPYGRVPEVEIFNLDHYCHEGPLARSVGDCRLLENVIAGPDPSDVASIRPKLEIPERLEPVEGMRLAFSPDLGCYRVDREVAANASAVVERLRAAGAVVEEVSLPWDLATLSRTARIHFGMIFGPSIAGIYDAHRDELTSYARNLYEESEQVQKAEYVEGLALEGKLYRPLGELLVRYDALICPTFAIPAFPAEWSTDDPLEVNGKAVDDWFDVMMTIPFNVASRCPVMSVPSGRSRQGVPTGVSIVGPTYDDVSVFRVAAGLERMDPWFATASRRPTF
jgi:Asp-tRNA(Asn)/Glu-tRNA(Gln) amidotransferase A subunit family amidase